MRESWGIHMKNKKPLSVSAICWITLVVALVIAIIVKSTVTFPDFISGKWQFKIPDIKEIIFNICIGLVASAFLTLIIELKNKRNVEERNIEIKKAVMRECGILVKRTLAELTSGTDRDILSVVHNYHHLEFLATNRLDKLKSYCEYFIENYTQIFDAQEITLFSDIAVQCQLVLDLTKDPYKNTMLSYDDQLSRYYSSKKYENMPLVNNNDHDKTVLKNIKMLDGIVSTNEKHVQPVIELLEKLEKRMPYIFAN